MKYSSIIRILDNSIQSIDSYNNKFPDPLLVPPIKGVKKIIFCKIFHEIYGTVNKKTIDNFIEFIPPDKYYITIYEGATYDINESQLIKLIIDSILYIYIKLENMDNAFLEFQGISFLTNDDDALKKVYTDLLANMTNYILSIPGLPAEIQKLMKNYKSPTMVDIPIYKNLPKPNMPGGKKTKNRKRKRISNKSVKVCSTRKYKRRNTNNSNKK